MLGLGPEGHEYEEAWRVLAEARRLLAHSCFDGGEVLALARSALASVRVSHVFAAEPSAAFIAARHEDVGQFADTVETHHGSSRVSLGTLLLSIEFVLRAAHYHARESGRLDRGDFGEPV